MAILELSDHYTPFEIKQRLDQILLFGTYPEVLTIEDKRKKIKHLKELSEAYLYKDILQLTSIKHTSLLHKLLKLVALQIGGLVSLQELSRNLRISFDTVRNYLEMLEKAFVIRTLTGFSKNPRKEISKMDKIYFVDTGIRNAVLNNFNPMEYRNDAGTLWENFLYLERTKYLDYRFDYAEQYFWRKYSGAEMDYVEIKDGNKHGYEFKWGKKKSRSRYSWQSDYPDAQSEIINRENFMDFVNLDI